MTCKQSLAGAVAVIALASAAEGSETKYADFSLISNAKATDQRILLGLKLHMGDKTLQQTDRAGATLDIMSPLANPSSPLLFPPLP